MKLLRNITVFRYYIGVTNSTLPAGRQALSPLLLSREGGSEGDEFAEIAIFKILFILFHW